MSEWKVCGDGMPEKDFLETSHTLGRNVENEPMVRLDQSVNLFLLGLSQYIWGLGK